MIPVGWRYWALPALTQSLLVMECFVIRSFFVLVCCAQFASVGLRAQPANDFGLSAGPAGALPDAERDQSLHPKDAASRSFTTDRAGTSWAGCSIATRRSLLCRGVLYGIVLCGSHPPANRLCPMWNGLPQTAVALILDCHRPGIQQKTPRGAGP